MTQPEFERPLSFGEILDVTFRIIKENFLRLFLIMLIFMGPILILELVTYLIGGVALLSDPHRNMGITSILGSFAQPKMQGASPNYGTTPQVVLLIISSLLSCLISIPIGYTSLIIATEQIWKKQTVNILTIIKRAFSRYWALLGGSLLFGLIMSSIYVGTVLIFVLYLAFSGGFGMFKGLAVGNMTGLGIQISVSIALTLSAFLGFIYLMTRWSFFFAAIVFEKVSPGLGKSWRLTRGCFWRLVGLNIVLTIIIVIIYLVLYLVVGFTLGNSVLALLLKSLVSIFVSITPIIAYAVIYLDLRVRNEAVDLKAILETYQHNTILSSTVDAVVTKPED